MKRTRQSSTATSTNQQIRRAVARAFLPVESLESRTFLSGTVSASISQGSLNLRGDTAANVIVVDQVGLTADQVRISGDADTAINGLTEPLILTGLTRNVRIQMDEGADSVLLRNLNLPGDVSVNSRGDASTVTLDNVQVAKSLRIKNGSSLSSTTINNSAIGKHLIVQPTSGGQTVVLKAVAVQRTTRIAGGKGADVLTIDDSTFHSTVRLQTARGIDDIRIEASGDPLGGPTQFNGPLVIATRGDADTLQIDVLGQTGNHSIFASKVTVNGGAGEDALRNFAASDYGANAIISIKSFETNVSVVDTSAPTISSTDPALASTGIARNRKIAVTFSESMDSQTIDGSTVTVTGANSTAVAGTIAYLGRTMTFTPTSLLDASTLFTVTVGTGVKDLAGNPMSSSFSSTFTTGATSDIAAPTVSSTDPIGNATNVALNKKISATFSESMDPSTITSTTVTVTAPNATPVTGAVAYVGSTMTFTPASLLAPNTIFTVVITTAAKDLAGNPLASDSTWTFTTGAAPDTVSPTITSTNPTDLKTNVAINKRIAVTFSESMDPLTLAANVAVKASNNMAATGTLAYDAATKTVTFTPSTNFNSNATYTATVRGGMNGVKDLAGNSLASDKVWTFTTGTQVAQEKVDLGRAAPFAVMATGSISSTGTTQINGDVGLNPGSAQGIPPAQVNGTIHVTDQAVIDAQTDLLSAYNDSVGRSVTAVSLPGNMGGLTFTPGLYTNSTSVLIQGAGPANNVTLDAQGDPDAIFIFQMGSTLTTGPGAQVILSGGAKASNIFWQVGTSATLDTTTIFKGNILAAVTITVNTGSVVEGRLLGGSNSDGSVTVNASTVTVPAV